MSKRRSIAFEEFTQLIARLVGKTAWRSKAGSDTGSIFTLQFGNPLPDDKRWGEFSLMVSCAWRIVKTDFILCTWHEDSDEALAPALQQLESTEVIGAVLSRWGDLNLHFSNELSLHIWNDDPFTEGESWFIGCQGRGYYAVEAYTKFTYEASE